MICFNTRFSSLGVPFYLRVLLVSSAFGFLFFLILMYVRRYLLRILLSYRGWMCKLKLFSSCLCVEIYTEMDMQSYCINVLKWCGFSVVLRNYSYNLPIFALLKLLLVDFIEIFSDLAPLSPITCLSDNLWFD